VAPKRYAAATRMGRLAKAKQFQLAANTISTIMDDQVIADAYVTLCVQAGIAAADVICCAKLGEHHQGENHNEAIALVARVDKTAAKNLNVLLDLKTKSSYSPDLTSEADQKRAGRAAAALVSAAQSA